MTDRTKWHLTIGKGEVKYIQKRGGNLVLAWTSIDKEYAFVMFWLCEQFLQILLVQQREFIVNEFLEILFWIVEKC